MKPERYFYKRIALVTGAAGAVGEEMTRQLHRMGAGVICADIDEMNLAGVVEELRGESGWPLLLPVDVTERKSLLDLREELRQRGITPDLLVCCTGLTAAGRLEAVTDPLFLRSLEVNLLGFFYTVQTFLEDLARKGGSHVVAFSSLGGITGRAGLAPYCAAKFALNGFCEALYGELQPHGVALSIICPGILKEGSLKNPRFNFPRGSLLEPGEDGAGLERAVKRYFGEQLKQAVPVQRAVRIYLQGIARQKLYISEYMPARFLPVLRGLAPGLYGRYLASRGQDHLALLDRCAEDYFRGKD